MASHNYQQFQYGLEKFPVTLYANIPVGASGAVGTMIPTQNQGIYNVVRNSAGVYVVSFGVLPQLQIDKYVRLLMADAMVVAASAQGLVMDVVADNASAGSVTIRFSLAGTPTDPASGSVLLLRFVLKNSSV